MIKGKEMRELKSLFTTKELNIWCNAIDKVTGEIVAYGRLEDLLYLFKECNYKKMD